MSITKVYINDEGTAIILDTKVDLSQATAVKVAYHIPGSTTPAYWDGTVIDLTKVRYITQTGDFNKPGMWSVQAYIETPSGKWHGETATFYVEKLMR